jgi:hypothetical protein
MNERDVSTFAPEEISRLVLQIPSLELKSIIPSLTPEQVTAAIASLDKNHDTAWREKIVIIIQGLTQTKHLEAAGHALSLPQILHLFDENTKNDPEGHWKFSPLLVGMSHQLFTQMLISATPVQLNTLKQEVIAEPLQHHLTVLTHEIIHQIPEFAAKIEDLDQEIDNLNPFEIAHSDLKNIGHRIEEVYQFYEQTTSKISKILILAWNTNRTDLIEKLSVAKELSQKVIGVTIGSRRTTSTESTGLFAKLENQLNKVYGILNETQDIEALQDDEPAIEALVKFSIWYLRDYWEIGLLPTIKDPKNLELETSPYNHDEKIKFREKIYAEVSDNLAKLGLKNVNDFKKAKIFSKASLIDYISKNADLMGYS